MQDVILRGGGMEDLIHFTALEIIIITMIMSPTTSLLYYRTADNTTSQWGGILLPLWSGPKGVAFLYLKLIVAHLKNIIVPFVWQLKPTQEQIDTINKILEAEEALVVDNDFILKEEDGIY